jgi:hypothetical protein
MGDVPIEATCSECKIEPLFYIKGGDIRTPKEHEAALSGQFEKHVKERHSGEDVNQAAARIVREATER